MEKSINMAGSIAVILEREGLEIVGPLSNEKGSEVTTFEVVRSSDGTRFRISVEEAEKSVGA